MFISTGSFPEEPSFASDSAALGCHLNQDHRFVSNDGSEDLFNPDPTISERSNELRTEAMRKAVCSTLETEIAGFNVHKIYLSGPNGMGMSDEPVRGPHVSIYATEASLLRSKNAVIIVCGDTNENMGIWAWRSVLGYDGMYTGTVMGMIAALHNSSVPPVSKSLTPSSPASKAPNVGDFTRDDLHASPGLVILNPGELCYSPSMNECFTKRAWSKRPRASGQTQPWEIHPTFNTVPGHKTAQQHIDTVLEYVLPHLVNPNARLFAVAVTDGSKCLAEYLNRCLVKHPSGHTVRRFASIAFASPFTGNAIEYCDELRQLVAARAKSWVLSEEPYGELLKTPQQSLTRLVGDAMDGGTAQNIGQDDGDGEELIGTAVSSGVHAIAELVMPRVMGDVVKYFEDTSAREGLTGW